MSYEHIYNRILGVLSFMLIGLAKFVIVNNTNWTALIPDFATLPNSESFIQPRIFTVYDIESERFDQIAAGHRISAAGRDLPIDPADPEEGVWIERRTKRGYERIMKAKLLHSDATRVEFTFDFDLPPRKYMIAIQTRCGRGKDYKTAICRHEVSIMWFWAGK